MSENTHTVHTWDEQVVSGAEGQPRYAHARVTTVYAGLIEGTGTCDYLVYYAGEGHDGGGQRAPGYERVAGGVAGRAGSFVIRHDVACGPEWITDNWTVVPGSGTGELVGLAGGGTASGAGRTVAYTFAHTLG